MTTTHDENSGDQPLEGYRADPTTQLTIFDQERETGTRRGAEGMSPALDQGPRITEQCQVKKYAHGPFFRAFWPHRAIIAINYWLEWVDEGGEKKQPHKIHRRAPNDSNQNLSRRRAESVVEKLKTFAPELPVNIKAAGSKFGTLTTTRKILTFTNRERMNKWFKSRTMWLAGLPAVIVLVSVLETTATISSPILPYLFPPRSPDGVNPAFLGNWYQEFEFPDRGFIVHFQGTIQYFSNKTYRITGELKATSTGPGLPLVIHYDYDGNGEWQATEAELVIKALNVKAPASRVDSEGVSIPASDIGLPADSPALDLGPKIMLAQSQRYDIRSTMKDKIVLETNGLYEDTFMITMTRTKRTYLR